MAFKLGDTTQSTPTLRSVIGSAFSFVKSYEESRSTAGITLDHMIEAQIEAIAPKDSTGRERAIPEAQGTLSKRLSRYDRLTEMMALVDGFVDLVDSIGDDEDMLRYYGIYEVDATGVDSLKEEDADRHAFETGDGSYESQ